MTDEEEKMIQILSKKMDRRKKWLILAVLSLMIIGLGAQSLEAAACERAFVNCMDEPFMQGNMLWIIYCGNGYAFCLKYID
jgi:hypothetical protein